MSKHRKSRVTWNRLVAGVVVCVLLAPAAYYFLYIYAPGPGCFATPRFLAVDAAVRAGTAKIEFKKRSDGEQGFLMRIWPTSEEMPQRERPSTNAESGACFEYEAQKHSLAEVACDAWGSTVGLASPIHWNDKFPSWAQSKGRSMLAPRMAATKLVVGKMPRGSIAVRAIESNFGRFVAVYTARSSGAGWPGVSALGSSRRKPRGPFYHLLIDENRNRWHTPAVSIPLRSYSRSTDKSIPVGIG